MTRFLLLALPLVTAACSGGSAASSSAAAAPAAPFTYATSDIVAIDLSVRIDGAPAPGVVVQVVGPYSAEDPSANDDDTAPSQLYWKSMTDEGGRSAAAVKLPSTAHEVDVILLEPGTRGPYTHEAQRLAWGPFAPAVRITVQRDQLEGLELDLQEL